MLRFQAIFFNRKGSHLGGPTGALFSSLSSSVRLGASETRSAIHAQIDLR